jgi:hypothetical protein
MSGTTVRFIKKRIRKVSIPRTPLEAALELIATVKRNTLDFNILTQLSHAEGNCRAHRVVSRCHTAHSL